MGTFRGPAATDPGYGTRNGLISSCISGGGLEPCHTLPKYLYPIGGDEANNCMDYLLWKSSI